MDRESYTNNQLAYSANQGAAEFHYFVQEVCGAADSIMEGKLVYGMMTPSDILSKFINLHFQALMLPIEMMKQLNPDGVVNEAGQRIAALWQQLCAKLRKLWEWTKDMGSFDSGKYRLAFSVPTAFGLVTNPDDFVRRVKSRRVMVLDRFGDFLRYAFGVLRDCFRLLESKVKIVAPVEISEYYRTFVEAADERRGYLLFRDDGGKLVVLNITAAKVWEVIRTLLASKHPAGYAKLPVNFRGRLINKDAANVNQLKDGDSLYQLSLHIVSVGNGEYVLSKSARTPNTVG